MDIDNCDEVYKMERSGKIYYIVGANHVSSESAALVSSVLEAVKPDSVCVELDQKRYETFVNGANWKELDIVEVFKQKKATMLLMQVLLGGFQKKLALDVKDKVGGEVRSAISYVEHNQKKICLVDRDVNITFKKIWRTMSFREKLYLPITFFESFEVSEDLPEEESIKELMKMDMVDSFFNQLKQRFPNIYKQMITERDLYQVCKIKESPGTVVVAILGNAHVRGVIDNFDEDVDLDVLEKIPEKSFLDKAIEWAFPLILLILILLGFVGGFESGIAQVIRLLLWNGGCAALFTLFTLAHPLTILTSFVAAPIGTFSPLLSVGMFSGIVEATLRKPVVKDFENLSTDIFNIKAYYKNRALRVLFIFVFASLGGVIGNIIGGLDLIKNMI